MREIKFRGKRKDNNEWVYGSLCVEKNGLSIMQYDNPDETDSWWDIIPETMGEFSGLRDRNNKEIYEGDTYQKFGVRYIITFKEGAFCAIRNHKNCTAMPLNWDGEEPDNFSSTIEITGNIYEPEFTLK